MARGAKLFALAAVGAALLLPAGAPAATVGVEELAGETQHSNLKFVGGAEEANRLTVSVAAEDADFYDLRLVDSAVPIQPGAGCRGGGEAGDRVLCKVRKPTLGENYNCFKGCFATAGTAWELNLSFALGGAGSSLDTTALPESSPNKSVYTNSRPVLVTVIPGAGDDTVLTGPGPDEVKPSPGADLIRTGEGADVLRAGPVADGPDVVDLGDGLFDLIDFSERSEGVRYEPDGQADDGSAGEGDNLGAAREVRGGAGADTLISAGWDPSIEPVLGLDPVITGGDGDDLIVGSERSDGLYGEDGDDELVGAGGDDRLKEPFYAVDEATSGDDSADGGPGDDEIELGFGDDEAAGGAGRDRIVLSQGNDTGDGGEGDDLLLGEKGRDELEGGPGKDRLAGDTGRDRLFGGDGDDRIAAGMVVPGARGYRTFLHAPGPLEERPDSVDCGTGRDAVRVGLGDTSPGCETVLRAAPLEVRGLRIGPRDFPPRIEFTVRGPGRARIEGKGLKPTTRNYRGGYGAFELRLTGWAQHSLFRHGHVGLRLRLSFDPVDGREVVYSRAFELWKRGGLEDRGPA
jgi:hypothetical protein